MKQLRRFIAAIASVAMLGGASAATADAAVLGDAGAATADAAVPGSTSAATVNAATYWYRGSNVSSIPGVVVPFPAQPGRDYVSYGTPGNCCGNIPTFSATYSGGILISRFANCDATRVSWCHISHESHLGPNAYAWRNGQALYLNAYQRLDSSHVTAGAGFLCYAAVNDRGAQAYACAQTWGGWQQAGRVNCPHESWGDLGGNTYGLFTKVGGARQGQVSTFGWQNFKIEVTATNLATAVHKCYPNTQVDPNQWRVVWIDRGWEAGGFPRAGHPGDGPSSFNVVEDVRQETVYSAPPSVLDSGNILHANQTISSPSGAYYATMQLDGNFVVNGSGGPIWSSGTLGHSGAFLSMQHQGNAVIYNNVGPIWSTNACGYSSGAYLVMKDNGNLVLYNADGSSRWSSMYGCGYEAPHTLYAGQILQPNQAIWSRSGAYNATMQLDGNFVVNSRGGPIWSSGTFGRSGAYLSMQHDGNVVIYHNGGPIWATTACGYSPGSYLDLKDDGNLVLHNANGSSRWSSRYGCA